MSGVLRRNDIRRLIVFAVMLLVIVPLSAWFAGGSERWQEAHWKLGLNLAALTDAPLATRIHASAILILVIAGWTMLALPKGDRRHRLMGWIWVSVMLLMGLTSMAVPHGDNWVVAYLGGGSALVLMAFGVYFVRSGKVRNHAKTMAMLMIALVMMTLLSLMPGRVMHGVFFAG